MASRATSDEQRLRNLVHRAFVAGWIRGGGPLGDASAQANVTWVRGLPDPKDREVMKVEQLEAALGVVDQPLRTPKDGP